MDSINADGFRWERFREYFPFGDISLSEGDYQRLVQKALQVLKDGEQKQVLLDLLDAQGCAFVEQTWVQNEQLRREGRPKVFTMEPVIATAWLQINDNLRSQHGLPTRGARSAMLALRLPETLAARITAPHT